MLSSDIGQAHCYTARYWQDIIPTEDYREAARRALRRRSRAKAATNEGRPAIFKPACTYRLNEMERVKGIEPSS
jgi:hypothetical protein